jgi:hypothetical protein
MTFIQNSYRQKDENTLEKKRAGATGGAIEKREQKKVQKTGGLDV